MNNPFEQASKLEETFNPEELKPPQEPESFEGLSDELQAKVTTRLSAQPRKNVSIGIGQAAGFVVIQFKEPVEKLVITKKEARELVKRISQETL